MNAFYQLENSIQSYAWGSKDGISAFTGIGNPDGRPMAELWMGAHPAASSMVVTGDGDAGRISLASFIKADPVSVLGKVTASRFDGKLPFLFKVLSAGAPLSLQVHPSRAQAVEGFDRENRKGIPLNDPERNYKDDNHKPEIIMAVTPFTAMCGFRPREVTAGLMMKANCPSLSATMKMLEGNGTYTDFCKALLGMEENTKKVIVCDMTAVAPGLAAKYAGTATGRAYELVSRLASFYPSDIGILAPLYLNVIDLAPGEAIYLSAGIMHAYIEGTGLELMANSDNVLRGGLTPKHIDIPELLSILNPDPFMPERILPPETSGIFSYRTECPEFELSRVSCAGGPEEFTADRPSIMIGATGEITANSANGSSCALSRGKTIFLPATGERVIFTGNGTSYIASIPVPREC